MGRDVQALLSQPRSASGWGLSETVSGRAAEQSLRLLTAGGCQLTALLTAGQQVISLRGIQAVNLCDCHTWL